MSESTDDASAVAIAEGLADAARRLLALDADWQPRHAEVVATARRVVQTASECAAGVASAAELVEHGDAYADANFVYTIEHDRLAQLPDAEREAVVRMRRLNVLGLIARASGDETGMARYQERFVILHDSQSIRLQQRQEPLIFDPVRSAIATRGMLAAARIAAERLWEHEEGVAPLDPAAATPWAQLKRIRRYLAGND